MTIKFTVPGVPVGKGRPRFTRSGHTYTPEKTKEYEETVRRCWQTQSGQGFAGGVPLLVTINAYLPIPKSVSTKRALEMEGAICTKKPDVDNIEKIVYDALNHHAYPDDAAVQSGGCIKHYTNGLPRVEVEIREAAHEP